MRKALFILLTLLSLAPMLTGCYYHPYPYRDDGYGRGGRHDRYDHRDRDYDDRRDGSRDYR
jgi:hypothetical protein